MWSDKLTEKSLQSEPTFDLTCAVEGVGDVPVQNGLNLEQATKIAEEGGIDDARFTLECAHTDQGCVSIQRPGKEPELLVPHNWE